MDPALWKSWRDPDYFRLFNDFTLGDNGVVEIPAGVSFVGFLGSTSSALTQREIGERQTQFASPVRQGGVLRML